MEKINNRTSKPVVSAKSKQSRPGAKTVSKEAKAVAARYEFTKSGNKMLVLGIIATSAASVFSSLALISAVNKDEIVKFVAIDEQGRIIKLVQLNQPNQSDEAVLQWTTQALIETFTFSAFDINYRLNEATNRFFTDEGANALLGAIKDSGNFDAVVEREMFVSVALEHTPILVDHVMIQNRFFGWKVLAPAIITYRTGTDTFTNKVSIEMVVSRRSLLEAASGLGISKIVLENSN